MGSILSKGVKTVTAAGTPEQLTPTKLSGCKSILIQPIVNDDGSNSNTGVVRVGEGTVTADLRMTIRQGDAGICFPCEDPTLLMVDAGVNGDGVTWTAFS